MTGPAPAALAALQRLQTHLVQDPDNPRLLEDVAWAALDAGEPERALACVDRREALSPLPASLINLRGLAALGVGQPDVAARAFEQALAETSGDMALRFNLAWSLALLKEHSRAAETVDEATARQIDGAAQLKVEMLHHLGRLEDALTWGGHLAGSRPHDTGLMGALAAVALDQDEDQLARDYAERAGQDPQGLAIAGFLTLQAKDADASLLAFSRALTQDAANTRAHLGVGLALLAKGRAAEAVAHLDRAAERFERHLGSWVAAGWAHFVAGDHAASRARFETALAIDDTFAEIHGGLAVLDVAQGDLVRAEGRAEVALRLDRSSFGGALARSLILEAQGDAQSAERIRQIVLNSQIGRDGRTLAQTMAALAGHMSAPS